MLLIYIYLLYIVYSTYYLRYEFGAVREGEEEMLNIIGEGGEGDGSEFFNKLGEEMEEEQPHESQTNDDCEDSSQGTRHALTQSGEVYIYIKPLFMNQ
jgi:hypothetical protein